MPFTDWTKQPMRRAVIQDLTCDSDGRIDQYIDGQNLENTMPLHDITAMNPISSAFMVGAYQEILGDMHTCLAIPFH